MVDLFFAWSPVGVLLIITTNELSKKRKVSRQFRRAVPCAPHLPCRRNWRPLISRQSHRLNHATDYHYPRKWTNTARGGGGALLPFFLPSRFPHFFLRERNFPKSGRTASAGFFVAFVCPVPNF